ncbi:MAG: phosphoribosyltransferase [Candidatus Hadarchaeaceae archaeon]
MELVLMSWEEVEEAVTTLADAIKREFDPDVIVGIARGGLIPAVRLSHLLGNKLLRVIHVRYYKNVGLRLKKPELYADIKRISGKVLVVDDVTDTGTSLEFVLKHLRRKGAKEIRVATIAYKPKSRFKPDYYTLETDKWVVFPWEEAPLKRGGQ